MLAYYKICHFPVNYGFVMFYSAGPRGTQKFSNLMVKRVVQDGGHGGERAAEAEVGGLGSSGGRSCESTLDRSGADRCFVSTGVVCARCGMGGVGSRSKEGWGEARLGKEVQMLSGLSDISDLTSVGVGGWMETGGAVRSSSPSVPFSKQSWRLSRNLKAVN